MDWQRWTGGEGQTNNSWARSSGLARLAALDWLAAGLEEEDKRTDGRMNNSWADWFICYFRVLGKSFREFFFTFLTSFSGSFRSTSYRFVG